MSINSYLDGIASKLIIRDDAKSAIDNSVSVFKNRMESYFLLHESVNLQEIETFGSYDRGTNLPQPVDYGTDVDIMLVMDDDGATPQTYLDRVRRAVEAKYSTSEIKQFSPTIVLQMNHIRFEITPAISAGYGHKIRNSQNQWMYTYCLTDLINLSTANKNNCSQIKPVIRMVKYWNKNKNYRSFASYQIEKTIVNYYQSCRYQRYDTKQYLLTALKLLQSLTTYDSQRERLNSAINKVQDAINGEETYPYTSLNKIKEIIEDL